MRKVCLPVLSMALLACQSDAPAGANHPASPDDASSAGPQADGSAVPAEAGSADDARAPTGPRDAGHDAALSAYTTRPLEGPEYQGSLNNGADCSTPYPTAGFEPASAAGTRHPLFLYFIGTAFTQDASSRHDNIAASAVTEAMARRGFVALSAAYDNGPLAWLSDHQNQLQCIFEGSEGLLARACALPQVDCSLGIAAWGHSQGGYVAMRAAQHDERVRAAWATGIGTDVVPALSKHRLRVVNGENDTSNGTAAVLGAITATSDLTCSADQCLRDDGSGWIIVRKAELADPATSSADHCWFDRRACGDGALVLEPSWVDPSSTRAYALESNADWLAKTALRADLP